MSNLFESLTKAELLQAGEFPLSPTDNTKNAAESLTASIPAMPPHSDLGEVNKNRIAPLRLSNVTPVLPFDEEHHAAAEQYRLIRTKILHHRSQPRKLLVSSSGSGDGKTVTAINLAAVFALKADVRVVLVDADMRRPQVANYLGVCEAPGLTEILSGAAVFDDAALYLEELPNLCVVPAGAQRRGQAELLDSNRWRQFVAALRDRFEYVIFDAPPVGTVADYDLVQFLSDGVIFVARPDHTQRNTCLEALQTIPNHKLLGVVLNCIEPWFLWHRKGYDYYPNRKPTSNI